MALVRQANARELIREAIVLDLGDLRRHGEEIIASARAQAEGIVREAEGIIREARAERERLVQGADKIGFEQGLARGFETGKAEGLQVGQQQGAQAALAAESEAIARLNTGWTAALDKFDIARDRMLAEGQRDVVKLACMIAGRVVKRAIELDGTIVTNQVGEVLSMVLRPTRLRLSVHPLDKPTVELALPTLAARFEGARNVELVGDEGVPRGSCVAQLAESGATIDASIGTQLDRIVEALLPGTPGGL